MFQIHLWLVLWWGKQATALELSRHILGARSAIASVEGQEMLKLDR